MSLSPATRPASPARRAAALLLCLLLPASASGRADPSPQGPGDTGPVETKVKIIPKPVPCVPCPCECPEVPRGPGVAPPLSVGPEVTPPDREGRPDRIDRTPRRVEPPEVRPPPPPPPRGAIAGEVTVRDRSGKERADRSDVVVYIKSLPQRKFAALKRTRQMAQRDKQFTPHLVAVTKGSVVEFPNEDKFFHNVFSLSEGNTFDLGLYRAGTSKSVTFEKSGVVDVYCNIHPNMWAQVLVLDNPFYAVSNKDGVFEIGKVPPGTYTVEAWISGGDAVRQQVRVDAGGKANLKFELREGATSKPHLNKFNQPYGRYK